MESKGPSQPDLQNEIDPRFRAKSAAMQLDKDVTRIRDGEVAREKIVQEELSAP